MRMNACACLAAGVGLAFVTAAAAQPASPGDEPPRTALYRFELVQAAPGRLLDLIDLYKTRAAVLQAAGDEVPLVVRHSQGDHWDLAIVSPAGTWPDYVSREREAKREAAARAAGQAAGWFEAQLSAMAAWREDWYGQGPPTAVFRTFLEGAGLAHFEMLQALPGKRDELVREREMENAYNRHRGRPHTLIFVRDQGAAWDVITLDVFRNWRHYAEQETLTKDVNDAAARAAGFSGADAIGPYMRTLISTHRDTLGPIMATGGEKR